MQVVALTIVLVFVYFMLQNLVAAGLLVSSVVADLARGQIVAERLVSALSERVYADLGLYSWLGIAVGGPAALAATWGLAHMLFGAARWRRMGLAMPRLRDSLLWLLVLVGFGFAWSQVVIWLDRPAMPDVMHQLFTTAGWMPGLVIAVVILAPAAEELIFRGFCLGGLRRLGAVGAIFVSSALFALIHLQYDPFDMFSVFLLGAIFGAARWHSRSTVLAFGLHAVHNGLATLQALWLIGGDLA